MSLCWKLVLNSISSLFQSRPTFFNQTESMRPPPPPHSFFIVNVNRGVSHSQEWRASIVLCQGPKTRPRSRVGFSRSRPCIGNPRARPKSFSSSSCLKWMGMASRQWNFHHHSSLLSTPTPSQERWKSRRLQGEFWSHQGTWRRSSAGMGLLRSARLSWTENLGR